MRVAWEPVELKPSTAFVRTPAPQGQKVPEWVQDKQWQARVEEICSGPWGTAAKSAGSGRSGSCYQINYGKQSSQKNCRRPTTPLEYTAGEGSRLTPNVDWFYENYTMAAWNSCFQYNGKEHPLPRNNLELEKYSIKYKRFENLVGERHRSASRDRRADEPEPTTESANVLYSWWMSKEQPYPSGAVPMPLSGNEGVDYVIENGEAIPVLDLDLLYDNSPHDGQETPFLPGMRTTWCTKFLVGT